MLLHAMHDRYAYFVDILLITLSFINKKHLVCAGISIVTSISTYSAFLFVNWNYGRWDSILNLLAYI